MLIKRIIFTVIAVLLAIPACAQLKQGQHIIGVHASLGFQLNNAGISYSDHGGSVDWGTLGGDFGLSYYYLIDSHIGIGAEIARGDFAGSDLTSSSNHKIEDDTTLYNFMFAARLTPSPESRFRFYIPIGIGLVSATQDLKIDYHGDHHHKKASDNSLGYFVGLGMESDIGQHGWSWGLEMRYNAFRYDSDKLVKGAPASIHADGKRRLDYMTFMLNINKRF